ncbi:hypothetical protein Q5P01_002880 [Channa striata]|uniref:Uncharacterized protein n=1 Tax=Channa striata TaxID=64152 RepID=A0AA88NNH5_CHASR|nr:hypothetical protein Q5P01_002880 [Channa striata]
MRYSVVLSGLVGICTWSTWKLLNNGPTDKKTDLVKINPSFQEQSQKKETVEGNHFTTTIEQIDEKEADDLRPELSQDSTKLNLQDQLLFKPEFTSLNGSLPLEKVFFGLLIHICGADLVESITTVCHYLWSVAGLIELTVSTAAFAFAAYKWKREKKRLQEELLQKEREREDVVIKLKDVKAELENQRGQTKGKLEEVERGREENKQNLQSVEKEIEESEMMSEKPQELLKRKERLLNEQWRLDQSKKGCEKLLLDYEKVLEPVDFQIEKLQRKGKVGM